MSILKHIVVETWLVTGQMAPYLLFGFLMAGILSVFVSPDTVERHLGRRGLGQVCKAALFGVPLPLCSCAVLPVAASLRRHGAGKGATLSFLVSTPQTGLDSIMVTHGLLGPVFVVYRVVTAFVSGILSGVLTLWVTRHETAESEPNGDSCDCGCRGEREGRVRRALRYGFIVLARDIGRAMMVGILISGVLSALVPGDYFADKLGPGIVSMLVMMLVGIPLYACSSGSVPIAFALMRMGVSPGAALVFLVTGPATNAASVTTIWKMLGGRSLAVYLLVIAGCSLAAGFLMDQVAVLPDLQSSLHGAHETAGWIGHVSAAILLVVLLPAFFPRRGHDK